MAASKSKTSGAASEAETLLQRRLEERRQLELAAEEILERVARGEPMRSEWRDLLEQIWDDRTIEQELSRMERVLKWKPRAGTKAVRAQARSKADAAAEKLRTEGQRIDEEIRLLQQHKQDLERAAAETEAVVSGYDAAVKQLQAHAPLFARKKVDAARAALTEGLRRRVGELKARLTTIDGVLELDPGGATVLRDADANASSDSESDRVMRFGFQQILHHAEAVGEAAGLEYREKLGLREPVVNVAKFLDYQQRLRDERPAVAEELAGVQAEVRKQIAIAEEALDFYVDKIG